MHFSLETLHDDVSWTRWNIQEILFMVSNEFETMHLKAVVWVKEASLLIGESVRLFVAFICLRLCTYPLPPSF